jgi:hypothetical protein
MRKLFQSWLKMHLKWEIVEKNQNENGRQFFGKWGRVRVGSLTSFSAKIRRGEFKSARWSTCLLALNSWFIKLAWGSVYWKVAQLKRQSAGKIEFYAFKKNCFFPKRPKIQQLKIQFFWKQEFYFMESANRYSENKKEILNERWCFIRALDTNYSLNWILKGHKGIREVGFTEFFFINRMSEDWWSNKFWKLSFLIIRDGPLGTDGTGSFATTVFKRRLQLPPWGCRAIWTASKRENVPAWSSERHVP